MKTGQLTRPCLRPHRLILFWVPLLAAACQGDGNHGRAVAAYPNVDTTGLMRSELNDETAVVETTRRTANAVCGRFYSQGESAEFVIDVRRERIWRSDRDPGVDALAAAACTRAAPGAHAGAGAGKGEAGEKKSGGH